MRALSEQPTQITTLISQPIVFLCSFFARGIVDQMVRGGGVVSNRKGLRADVHDHSGQGQPVGPSSP